MSNRTIGLGFIGLFLISFIGMGVLWAQYGWMPPQKSNLAPIVDAPFYFVHWAGALLTLGVVGFMMYFMWTFRRKTIDEQTESPEETGQEERDIHRRKTTTNIRNRPLSL